MQVKMFSSKGDDYHNIEREINDWLENNPGIKVVATTESCTGNKGNVNFFHNVTFWYELGK